MVIHAAAGMVMDQKRLDDLVRRLSEHVSRRGVVATALAGGAAMGAGALDAEAGGGKAKGRKRGAGKPDSEGPCGNKKRKDNICTRNQDCCTNICETKLGKKNKDGKGRCRCIRTGNACIEDRNCCNAPCVNQICGYVS